MNNFNELSEDLEAHGDFKTYEMEVLFKIYGTSAPKQSVLADIKASLNRRNIETFPMLSTNPNALVRLYFVDSPIGQVCEALQVFSHQSDKRLRDLTDNATLLKKVQQIKRLAAQL